MINILLKYNLFKLFLLAILLRLVIMPFYFHPDIKTTNFKVSFLKEGVIDIYNYLDKNINNFVVKENLNYFPLTYFFLGGYQMVVSPLLGSDFPSWLSDASAEATERIGTFRYLFILKFPYLILDMIIPFLLIKFLDSDTQKRKAFILWLFNPLSISIIYIFSNIDLIPVTLSILGILFFQQKKNILSGLILGLAVGFKQYPMLFLPFLTLFIKNFRNLVILVCTIFGVVIVFVAPFWSNAFLHSALLSSLTTRLAFPGIGIGFGEALMIGVVALSVLFFTSLLQRNEEVFNLWYYLTALLLLTFSTIHFHIQWLLWIMPFLILLSILHANLSKLVWIWAHLAFLIPLLYDDKSMTISLLSPISLLYNLLPTPFSVLERFYDPYLVQGILHSIIFGIGLVLAWRIFRLLRI